LLVYHLTYSRQW